MPTYEYACKECGEHLEVQQAFTDAALTECPACHGPLRKVFGNIAITFKGSGFYKNDSRSSSTAATKSSEKSSETATSATDAAAKPAEKTAAPEKSTPKPAAEKAAS